MLQLGSGQWSLAHIASPDPDPGHNYTTIVTKGKFKNAQNIDFWLRQEPNKG